MGFLLRLASSVAAVAFHFGRILEALLPQKVLSIVLWPAAALWSVTERRKRRNVRAAWHQFPAAWRPRWTRYALLQNVGLAHSRFIYLWADRLFKARWVRHVHLRGHFDLEQFRHGERPIIFATLHFGPLQILPVWLRVKGIPVTMLVGPAEPRHCLRQRFYVLSPPAHIPFVLPITEVGHIRHFVGPGRRLLLTTDVDRGKQVEVKFDEYSFRLATGAIRLAAITGAEVIPCLIYFEKGAWEVAIHFGAPVPRKYLHHSPNSQRAAVIHLLGEFLPVLSRHPTQINPRFLSCITPSIPGSRSRLPSAQ